MLLLPSSLLAVAVLVFGVCDGWVVGWLVGWVGFVVGWVGWVVGWCRFVVGPFFSKFVFGVASFCFSKLLFGIVSGCWRSCSDPCSD